MVTTTAQMLTYYRGYSGSHCSVEQKDLDKATADWTANIIPLGFDRPITTAELTTLGYEFDNKICTPLPGTCTCDYGCVGTVCTKGSGTMPMNCFGSCTTGTVNNYGCVSGVCTAGAGTLPAGCGTGCGTTGGCTGTPGPVTNVICTISGNTVTTTWTPPASGTYDRFRIDYYPGIGTALYTRQYSTTPSDTYTGTGITSVHIRAMCGTAASTTYPVTTCGTGTGGCTPSYIGTCRQPLNGYEYDVNNCPGSVDILNSACIAGGGGGGGTTTYYRCDTASKLCVSDTTISANTDGCTASGQSCGNVGITCGTGQMNLLGSCYKTSNVMIVGAGVLGLVLVMSILKK